MNVPISALNSKRGETNILIQEQILRFLHKLNFSAFKDLEVDASDRVVTLRGVMQSFYDKQVAITHSLNVIGHHELVDEIVVLSDEEIESLSVSPNFS